MNENLKKFMEFLSAQDEETRKKFAKMDEDELIAYAAENGITVTAEELAEVVKEAKERAAKNAEGELSDDELDAVAGGGVCVCPVVGGGTEEINREREESFGFRGDGGCACVGYGQGDLFTNSKREHPRCVCAVGGYGETFRDL